MTIEITRPEIEALIQRRLQSGAFADVEEVLLAALRSGEAAQSTEVATAAEAEDTGKAARFANLSDLLLNSPFSEADLDLSRYRDYPRPVDLE